MSTRTNKQSFHDNKKCENNQSLQLLHLNSKKNKKCTLIVKQISAVFLYIISSSSCFQCFEFVKHNLTLSLCIFESSSKNSTYHIFMIVNDFHTYIYMPSCSTLLTVSIKLNANCTHVQSPYCLYCTENYFNQY